jgi:hypothetical protein
MYLKFSSFAFYLSFWGISFAYFFPIYSTVTAVRIRSFTHYRFYSILVRGRGAGRGGCAARWPACAHFFIFLSHTSVVSQSSSDVTSQTVTVHTVTKSQSESFAAAHRRVARRRRRFRNRTKTKVSALSFVCVVARATSVIVAPQQREPHAPCTRLRSR